MARPAFDADARVAGPVIPRTVDLRGSPARRWLGVLGVALVCLGCTPASPPSGSPIGTETAPPAESTTPTIEPTAASSPTSAPPPTSAPVATPTLNAGFLYSDILKVQVNRLAVRKAPKRTSGLVHEWRITGDTPANLGEVRLSTGDFVSVHLGPVPIGDTVWYLVWPADGAKLHQSANGWYDIPPMTGSEGPGWVAASVGNAKYMTLHRRPALGEIEDFLPLGVNAAGTGNYLSDPQPRHDLFLFDWAAAAPTPGTSCSFKVTLVPEDNDFAEALAVETSTTSVKVAPLTGTVLNIPWLPAPDGSWAMFSVGVTSNCTWAIRLTPLHHD